MHTEKGGTKSKATEQAPKVDISNKPDSQLGREEAAEKVVEST